MGFVCVSDFDYFVDVDQVVSGGREQVRFLFLRCGVVAVMQVEEERVKDSVGAEWRAGRDGLYFVSAGSAEVGEVRVCAVDFFFLSDFYPLFYTFQ